MKTLRKMKKGFTIVELVIVIAVIAVLTAILVPTFISISNKANQASDKSLVKNLNTALRMAEGEQGKKNETMFDAVEDVKEYAGIALPQFISRTGDEILWDSVKDEFVWKAEKPAGRADILLWTIVDSYDSTTEQSYSMFAGSKWSSEATSVTGLTVGFDVGYHSEITTVSYTRPDSADLQTAIIRTNSEEAVVTITAKSDIVKHYGKAKKVDVVKVDLDNSFHSNGNVVFIQLDYGHFVADAGTVGAVYATTNDTIVDENGGVIIAAYAANNSVHQNGNEPFIALPSGGVETIIKIAEKELLKSYYNGIVADGRLIGAQYAVLKADKTLYGYTMPDAISDQEYTLLMIENYITNSVDSFLATFAGAKITVDIYGTNMTVGGDGIGAVSSGLVFTDTLGTGHLSTSEIGAFGGYLTFKDIDVKFTTLGKYGEYTNMGGHIRFDGGNYIIAPELNVHSLVDLFGGYAPYVGDVELKDCTTNFDPNGKIPAGYSATNNGGIWTIAPAA